MEHQHPRQPGTPDEMHSTRVALRRRAAVLRRRQAERG